MSCLSDKLNEQKATSIGEALNTAGTLNHLRIAPMDKCIGSGVRTGRAW